VFLGEPGRTGYDLHFRLLGIAIRIHPGFWVVAALLGFGSGDNAPETILAFVAAVLISIVIHELGHALLFRRYRISSKIVLYHFGGLAIPDSMEHLSGSSRRSRWQQLFVSAAGPAAQLLLALVVIVALRLGGFSDGLVSHYLPPQYTADPVRSITSLDEQARADGALVELEIPASEEGKQPTIVPAIKLELLKGLSDVDSRALEKCDRDGNQIVDENEIQSLRFAYMIPNPTLRWFVFSLLFVSIFWALLNLMPVYPLDGGQIARELFLVSGVRSPVEKSLMLSVATGVLIGIWALSTRQSMAGLMFLMLAWSSYQLLDQFRRMGGGGYGRY